MFYRNVNLISFPFELDILFCISAQSNILFGACFVADGETALQFCDVGSIACNISGILFYLLVDFVQLAPVHRILRCSIDYPVFHIGQRSTVCTFQGNLIFVYRTVCILVILHSPVIQFLHICRTGNVFDCNRLNSCIRMISIFDFQVYLIIGHLIFTVAACFRIGNQAVVRLSCRCAGKSIIQFLQLVFRCRSSAYCSRISDIPVFVIKAGDIALPGSIFAHDSCPRSNTVQPGHCLC